MNFFWNKISQKCLRVATLLRVLCRFRDAMIMIMINVFFAARANFEMTYPPTTGSLYTTYAALQCQREIQISICQCILYM